MSDRRERDRRYNQSEKGRARNKRYNDSAKGQARRDRWEANDGGRCAVCGNWQGLREPGRGNLPVKVATPTAVIGPHHQGWSDSMCPGVGQLPTEIMPLLFLSWDRARSRDRWNMKRRWIRLAERRVKFNMLRRETVEMMHEAGIAPQRIAAILSEDQQTIENDLGQS